MKSTIQVFLQLREANRYAIAKNPILRRLAVVLLDNVVELQLARKAHDEFARDTTTWYSGIRKHKNRLRHGVARNHGQLLNFAKEQGWITVEDTYLLRYTHRVRNSFYHEGCCDALDAELAIRLMFRFVSRYFPQWRGSESLIQISPHEPIPIEVAAEDTTGFCPLVLGCEDKTENLFAASNRAQAENYWKKAMKKLLTYRPRGDIRKLIHRKCTEFLDQLDGHLRFIAESKDLDFNWILSHRFTVQTPVFSHNLGDQKKRIGMAWALNIYLAVLKDEERLLDIEKPVERAKEFHRLLNIHSFVRNPLSRQKIMSCRKKAEKLLTMTEEQGIGVFLQMEEELSQVAHAVDELAFDLEGYHQLESDLARGK